MDGRSSGMSLLGHSDKGVVPGGAAQGARRPGTAVDKARVWTNAARYLRGSDVYLVSTKMRGPVRFNVFSAQAGGERPRRRASVPAGGAMQRLRRAQVSLPVPGATTTDAARAPLVARRLFGSQPECGNADALPDRRRNEAPASQTPPGAENMQSHRARHMPSQEITCVLPRARSPEVLSPEEDGDASADGSLASSHNGSRDTQETFDTLGCDVENSQTGSHATKLHTLDEGFQSTRALDCEPGPSDAPALEPAMPSVVADTPQIGSRLCSPDPLPPCTANSPSMDDWLRDLGGAGAADDCLRSLMSENAWDLGAQVGQWTSTLC